MTLNEFWKENPSAALGFSGGVDSAYLLYSGLAAGARVGACYIATAFQPGTELEGARRLAESLGVPLRVVEADILTLPEVARNPPDRCCHCKRALFSLIAARAAEDGFALVIDGTNASDDFESRPGMRALRELGVRSPLRECGLAKSEIRRLSRLAGLPTWDKPSNSCLATRLQTGVPITPEALARVESAEAILHEMGFTNLRVRIRGENAVIQLPEVQLERVLAIKDKIIKRLKPGFGAVMLDLEGRE